MAAPQKGRKSPRAHVALVARYRSPTAFEFVAEQCSDLSAGGMFIRSQSPAPAGTLIKLECDVDDGAQKIRGVARVVWLREVDTDGQPAGMGVKFVKLDPGGREAITAILARLGADTQEPEPAAIARRSSPPPIPPEAGAARIVARAATASAGETPAPGAPAKPVPEPLPVASMPEAAAPSSAEKVGPTSKPAPAQTPTSSTSAPAPKPATARTPENAAAASAGAPRAVIYLAAIAVAAFALYALRTPQPAAETKAVAATQPPAPPAPASEAPTTSAPAAEPAPAPASQEAAPGAAAVTSPAEVPSSVPNAAPEAEAKYMLEVATAPEGARVTAGAQTLTAPGTLDLGKLEEPIQLVAEKSGFLTATAVVDRVGFMLDEGQMRRRIELTLEQEPKPAQAHAAANSKSSESGSASSHRAHTKPRASASSEKAPSSAAPSAEASQPAEAAQAVAEPSPPAAAADSSKSSAKQTPMQVAALCLASGDNACVIKALEGKAKGPRELELLIETYRTVGQTDKAEKEMQLYLDKYPNERHASNYRHMLDLHQGEPEAPH